VPELSSRQEQFAALNAQVMDISVDSIPSHIAWQKKDIGMAEIPLCADFFPHGEVTQKFGILREGAPIPGISERAAFIVDKNGRIAFSKVYPLDELPDVGEILGALKKLQHRAP
jgi:alkyl hydroperoxide reductase subunit AhpC